MRRRVPWSLFEPAPRHVQAFAPHPRRPDDGPQYLSGTPTSYNELRLGVTLVTCFSTIRSNPRDDVNPVLC
jgi:hypothetical protein